MARKAEKYCTGGEERSEACAGNVGKEGEKGGTGRNEESQRDRAGENIKEARKANEE